MTRYIPRKIKASKPKSSQPQASQQLSLPSPKIKRGYLPVPNLSCVTKRIQRSYGLRVEFYNNQMEMNICHTEYMAKLWKEINLLYKIHRWKGPKKLIFHQPIDIIRAMYGTGVYLSQLTNLEHLETIFDHCQIEHDCDVIGFTTRITRNLHNLRYLSIALHNCKEITMQSLSYLGVSIGRYLVNLQSLELSFGKLDFGSKIVNLDLDNFGSELFRHLRRLQSLKIGLYKCRSISDDGLLSLLAHMHKHLVGLKSLSIVIKDTNNITDRGIDVIRNGIVRYPANLEHLTLDFSCSNVTDYIFEALTDMMTHVPNLKSLELFLCSCPKITSNGLVLLTESILSRLKKLEYVTLSFAGSYKVPVKSVNQLYQELSVGSCVEIEYQTRGNPNET